MLFYFFFLLILISANPQIHVCNHNKINHEAVMVDVPKDVKLRRLSAYEPIRFSKYVFPMNTITKTVKLEDITKLFDETIQWFESFLKVNRRTSNLIVPTTALNPDKLTVPAAHSSIYFFIIRYWYSKY